MRIFVGEYVCGGGFVDQPIDSIPVELRDEGAAMLRAITQDLQDISTVVLSLDSRFDVETGNAEVVLAEPGQPVFATWIDAAKECDAALIVAPESNGVLAKAVGMLRAAGIEVIAGSGDFLRVASDKLQTARTLHTSGVAHPPYLAVGDDRFESQFDGFNKFVLKPRDGCGTQEIRIFDCLKTAKANLTEDYLLQPWIAGQPVSIALVASGNHQTFLPAVGQNIQDADCGYAGGNGPLDDDAQRRATALAARALEAMPASAKGFVGLDLLLGDKPGEDYVIEVNPRLTTSYVGLRKMIKGNLAARLFDLETGPVCCSESVDSVKWTPDGKVWIADTLVDESLVNKA